MNKKTFHIQKNSILNMHNKIDIVYNDQHYDSLYKLVYVIGYPSKHTIKYRKDEFRFYEAYANNEFEVREEYVYTELIRCIVALCNLPLFRKALERTKTLYIQNHDNTDKYFAYPHNVYGECLMIVRDYKLYL